MGLSIEIGASLEKDVDVNCKEGLFDQVQKIVSKCSGHEPSSSMPRATSHSRRHHSSAFPIHSVGASSVLVCNWLHSVGQNHFYVMMLLYRGSVIFRSLLIQSYDSRRFCSDSKSEKSDPLHPSGRHDIPSGRSTVQASSVLTTRTFRPNLPLC